MNMQNLKLCGLQCFQFIDSELQVQWLTIFVKKKIEINNKVTLQQNYGKHTVDIKNYGVILFLL